MNMIKPNPGSRPYSPFLLSMYDTLIHGFNMNYVWKCPTDKHQLPLFRKHFSRRHMDIGVATGYFPVAALQLAASKTSTLRDDQRQSITLVDMNTNSLQKAESNILSRFPAVSVSTVTADVTAPPPPSIRTQRFKSISMMNLLHCVPGPSSRKSAAFKNYAGLLDKDGVLFGCTVLGYSENMPKTMRRNWLYHLEMKLLNWKGAFSNWSDGVDTFDDGLRQEFEEVETWTVGSMLLFTARKPIRK